MPDCRAAPVRRSRAAPLWLGIRGCSFAAPPLVIVREGGQSSKHKSLVKHATVRQLGLRRLLDAPLSRSMTVERTLLSQIRRDLLAGLDQRFHRAHRFLEHAALGA